MSIKAAESGREFRGLTALSNKAAESGRESEEAAEQVLEAEDKFAAAGQVLSDAMAESDTAHALLNDALQRYHSIQAGVVAAQAAATAAEAAVVAAKQRAAAKSNAASGASAAEAANVATRQKADTKSTVAGGASAAALQKLGEEKRSAAALNSTDGSERGVIDLTRDLRSACERCHRRKIRCSGGRPGHPCIRCVVDKQQCYFGFKMQLGRPSKADVAARQKVDAKSTVASGASITIAAEAANVAARQKADAKPTVAGGASAAALNSTDSSGGSVANPSRDLRSACERCHRRKIRCSGGQPGHPCIRCVADGQQCFFGFKLQLGRPCKKLKSSGTPLVW